MAIDRYWIAPPLLMSGLLAFVTGTAGCVEFDTSGVAIDDIEAPATSTTCLEAGYRSVAGAPGTYRYFDTREEWPEARATCQRTGGHLITIDDLFEHTTVVQLLPLPEPGSDDEMDTWIGLNDQALEGSYLWTEDGRNLLDDPQVGYPPWGDGQPDDSGLPVFDEDCVKIKRDEVFFEWHDDECDEPEPFLCECDV